MPYTHRTGGKDESDYQVLHETSMDGKERK
jgi:hypothetical protein